MGDAKTEIISRVRSCLISTKGKVTLKQLEDDYRTLLGERIPYSRLGYKSLEQFLQSVPSIMVSYGPNGQTFVDAAESEKSAHISSMVRKQKSVAPKRKLRFTHAPTRFSRATNPPPTTPRWRPKRAQATGGRVDSSPRLAAVSHNQFVTGGGYRKPSVPSKVVVPERREKNVDVRSKSPPHKELRRINSTPEKTNSNETDDRSPLVNTMKRISKIMSDLNMDRDSGNSSPTEDDKIFAKTGDPIVDLRNFAAYHKLGEVDVQFTQTKAKKSKVVQCYCKVTIGQHKYSSYPEDFVEPKAAERHASQRALNDLMTKYSKRRSLLLSSNDDIIMRIPPMLEKHNCAVWMWQIEADYIDKYNEQLPSDWLQIVDNSFYVSIEKCLGGYVLKYCNPENALQKGKKTDMRLNASDVSVPCNTINFEENDRIYAVIASAHSTDEIWCQQCGTPEYENFLKMSKLMNDYYSSNSSGLVASDVHFGSYYVICHDGDYARVRALSKEDEYVHCFLIDDGDEVRVRSDSVYVLERQFAVEQAQAFVCKMAGLDDLHEVSVDSDHLNTLVGRECVLEIVTDNEADDDIIITVVMYDVNTDASINEELISLLTFELAQPVLDKTGVTEVYVSNIESNGDVYVQVRNYGFQVLSDLIKGVQERLNVATPRDIPTPPTPTPTTSKGRIYMTKCKISKTFGRARVIDWSPKCDLAQIYFIDVGNAQVISIAQDKLYPAETLEPQLQEYPPQAVRTKILLEDIPQDFTERAAGNFPLNKPVLVRINDYDSNGVPLVEFFKRTNEGALLFINKNIAMEIELQQCMTSNNGENSKKRLMSLVQFSEASKTVPSGGTLKKPHLPHLGAYFNVNVPFAVNPWNFFVQPLDSFHELASVMAEMQLYYNDLQFSPIPIDDVTAGKIYASKHEDGLWYRTSVMKVIHSGSISVFYCDFGYYTSLNLTQLVPLDLKFMSLPYQALKAKIAGIKPSKDKWTMEDCDVFQSLVMKKQFVSILADIEKDELHKSDQVLQLLLIDTSSEHDVYIKEVLVDRGIAVAVK